MAHWDGYSGDVNNFFVYVDPEQGRELRFIPWDTDTAYEPDHPFLPDVDWPRSAYAWARLPRGLYALEETRERYRELLRQELSEHWDADALHEKIDLFADVAKDSAAAASVETLHAFIDERRAQLTLELDAPAKPWTLAERGVWKCRTDAFSSLVASFDTTWDLAATTALGNTLTATVQGAPLVPIYVIASAGVSLDPAAPGNALRLTVGNPDGSFTLFQFQLGVPSLG